MRRLLVTLTALLVMAGAAPAAAVDDAVVRGILFYSPNCGHCHRVVEDHLPAVFEEYGGHPAGTFDARDAAGPPFTVVSNGTVELLMANVTTDPGAELYVASSAEYRVPEEMMGVPRLVMGDEFHVGSQSVPEALWRMIANGVTAGGIDWPELPGLADILDGLGIAAPAAVTTTTVPPATTTAPPTTEVMAAAPTTTTVPPPPATSTTIDPFSELGTETGGTDGFSEPLVTIGDKFRNDLGGNILAVVVLVGMLASLLLVVALVRRGRLRSTPEWLVPLLAIVGMAVAVYLTYIETSGADAVCGPVGNCNAVQESKFALLFGVIHVGLVGLISYGVVAATWLVARFGSVPWSDGARAALAVGAAGGVAFSIYLTFLEPFVIGASCIWCLTSAVVVTAIFWVTAGPGWAAWERLRGR